VCINQRRRERIGNLYTLADSDRLCGEGSVFFEA
jgi:hypothetical protein